MPKSNTCKLKCFIRLGQLTKPPKMSVSAKNRNVREGEDVKLTCHAHGTDLRTAEWFKEKTKLPERLQSITEQDDYLTRTLILKQSSPSDTGTYECRVYKVFSKTNLRQYPGYWSVTKKLHVLGENYNIRQVVDILLTNTLLFLTLPPSPCQCTLIFSDSTTLIGWRGASRKERFCW